MSEKRAVIVYANPDSSLVFVFDAITRLPIQCITKLEMVFQVGKMVEGKITRLLHDENNCLIPDEENAGEFQSAVEDVVIKEILTSRTGPEYSFEDFRIDLSVAREVEGE